MSSLRTICLEIRKSVRRPRLATYETAWKVWLHPSHPCLPYVITCVVFSLQHVLMFQTDLVLISSEDPVRVELSLKAAESLVRKNSFAAREVRRE